MSDFSLALITAIGLVFVIEGVIYSLFPNAMKRMMTIALSLPTSRLRSMGLVMALFGFVIVWLVR
ncbi:MAG: ubiquitin-binding protein [Rhodospirillaceae bacterium]|nr:ubiquitin-binding protein [Rhodospirillaceae bacterium]|tara:strand:+ start:1472 stop:1666 length:195 start_codon:yes stop_codon:yes gene_type:complete